MKRTALVMGAWLALVSTAAPTPVNLALINGDTLPAKLSDFQFFRDGAAQVPNARVKGYTLNTPLFSDYAVKQRFMFVPAGTKIRYNAGAAFEFPVGSAIIKSFGYPADFRIQNAPITLIETRVLLKRASGWIALPYIWNADGTDAVLKRAGTRIPVSFIDTKGVTQNISYSAPNANQCKGCHDVSGALIPIGPKARNLNDGKQLQSLVATKMLDHLPKDAPRVPIWDDPASGSLNARARAYLDVNCGHCHSRDGPANTSGLWLDWHQPQNTNLGLGKRPTAAGRGSGNLEFAIAPGHPELSYLPFRMKNLDPGIAMPELGRQSVHTEGVAVIEAWIRTLK